MDGASHPTKGAAIHAKVEELKRGFGFTYNEQTRMFIAFDDLPGTVRNVRGSNIQESAKLGPLSLFKYDLTCSDVWEDLRKWFNYHYICSVYLYDACMTLQRALMTAIDT